MDNDTEKKQIFPDRRNSRQNKNAAVTKFSDIADEDRVRPWSINPKVVTALNPDRNSKGWGRKNIND